MGRFGEARSWCVERDLGVDIDESCHLMSSDDAIEIAEASSVSTALGE